jgi:RNA polymerase sigma-70 factor (ECF subfamily)
MASTGRTEDSLPPRADKPPSTLDELYRRHAAWLGRMLAWRLRATPLDVDDIVQETYIRVARYDATEAGHHPKALLLRIAVNLARDQMRRNSVRGGLAAPIDALDEAALPRLEPEQHSTLEMKQAILSLPAIYRDVFVLSRFTGLTYQEIASHVGVPVKTVEWRMSRALAMCAAKLRD